MIRAAVTLTLALGLLLAPLSAEAQQAGKVYRIGWLDHTSLGYDLSIFTQALSKLGWAEGKSFVLEYRGAGGKIERLPEVATELVRLPVDVIVAPGTAEALAARKVTSSLPIVFFRVLDPVESGLVKSLARPGGNATGLTNIHAELSSKLLELVAEAVPKASRVAVLWEPAHAGNDAIIKTLRAAAPALRVSLQSVETRHHTEIEPAFLAMKRQGVDAVIVLWSNMMGRVWIADLALKHRLPLASTAPVYAWEGGLLSYTDNQDAVLARAAAFIDKILKGAKPADIPVEQPTKFELLINMKTAKALGLMIPQSVLFRADKIIE